MVLARRLRLHRVLVRVVRQHEVLARHLRQRKVLVRLLRQPNVLARLPRQDWLPVAPVTPETRDLAPVSRDWVVSHEICYLLLMFRGQLSIYHMPDHASSQIIFILSAERRAM